MKVRGMKRFKTLISEMENHYRKNTLRKDVTSFVNQLKVLETVYETGAGVPERELSNRIKIRRLRMTPAPTTRSKESTSISLNENNSLPEGGRLFRRTKAQCLRGTPPLIPVKSKLSFTVPKTIQPIIDHWASCGLKQNKPNTKILRQTIHALTQLKRGTFFNNKLTLEKYKDCKFTDDEIKLAIDHFAMAATLDDYSPEPGEYKDRLAKMDLIVFLYNPFNNGAKGNKSLFIKYFLHPPKLVSSTVNLVNDPTPNITGKIREWWVATMDNWLRGNEPITSMDENNFRRAAACAVNFFEEHKNKLHDLSFVEKCDSAYHVARWMCEAIEDDIRSRGGYDFKIITTNWLCNDITWKKVVPQFLEGCGMLGDRIVGVYGQNLNKEEVDDVSRYYDPRDDHGLSNLYDDDGL